MDLLKFSIASSSVSPKSLIPSSSLLTMKTFLSSICSSLTRMFIDIFSSMF